MRTVELPGLTTEQMQAIEHRMSNEFHIEPMQMIENTGRNLAALAMRYLDGDVLDKSVVVLAGRGNNGAGGLVAARYLMNWGAWVQILCSYPLEEYSGSAAHQLSTLQAMDAPLAWAEDGWELPPCDLLLDAVIGYGLRGDPRGRARTLIELANSSTAPVLSLEAPSGLDTETGRVFSPHIRAAATMALAWPKRGRSAHPGRETCGDLFVADIGVPAALYAVLGFDIARLFAGDSVVRLQLNESGIRVQT